MEKAKKRDYTAHVTLVTSLIWDSGLFCFAKMFITSLYALYAPNRPVTECSTGAVI